MNGHNFTPIQKALGTGEEYRQCQLGGQVAFVYNDPFCEHCKAKRKDQRIALI